MKSNDKFKKPKRAFTARYTAPSRRLREVCSTFVHKDKFFSGKIDSNCLNKKGGRRMEIFGTITVWRHSGRGNMSVPSAEILQIGIMSILWVRI